jgi:hypothetical protein
MTDQTCPNCGSELDRENFFGELVAEKLDLLAMLEGNGQSLASERHETTRLLRLLEWVRVLHTTEADISPRDYMERMNNILSRINEGSE